PFSRGVPKAEFTLQNAVFDDFKTPYSYHYNLTVQREMVRQLVVSIGYVGSLGKHLIERSDGNTPIPIILPGGKACTGDGVPDSTHPILPAGTLCTPSTTAGGMPFANPRRNPAWGELQTRRLSGPSYYNALEVLVSRRFSGGLQVQGTYTFSRSIDTS